MTDKQRPINMKTCFMLLLLISLSSSSNNRLKQRSWMLHHFQDMLDDSDDEEYGLQRRNSPHKQDQDSDAFNFDQRDFNEKQYMELRATPESNQTNSGSEITLQNRAAMNTRLRVLYTDANGNPAIVETGRLLVGQTKSVKLPSGAKNVNIIVEKDLFFENWRVAYKGTLTNENQCIRIVGVTLISKIHPCK